MVYFLQIRSMPRPRHHCHLSHLLNKSKWTLWIANMSHKAATSVGGPQIIYCRPVMSFSGLFRRFSFQSHSHTSHRELTATLPRSYDRFFQDDRSLDRITDQSGIPNKVRWFGLGLGHSEIWKLRLELCDFRVAFKFVRHILILSQFLVLW